MTTSVLASLLSLALLEPAAAVEPGASVSLRWQAPSECMNREQALVRLRELLPELPEQLPNEQGTVAVAVEITGTTATVRFVSPRGTDERRLEGQTCASAAAAAVVVIAVAVEAEAEAEPAEPPPAEPEQPEPAPPAEPVEQAPEPSLPVAPEQPRDEPPPKQRVRGHVGVLGGGGLGPLDAGMGAMVLEIGAHGRSWRASARAVWVPPRTIALADDDTLIGRYDGGFGGARVCHAPAIAQGRIELPVCAGFEAGVLRGRGVDTTPSPNTATQPWAAVQLGPGLRYVPNRWIAVGIEVDVVMALLRGGFTIGGVIAESQAPIGVRALAGLEVRFP